MRSQSKATSDPIANTLDRPVGEPPMGRWHVLQCRRVVAIATGSPMGCDPFALVEYPDRVGSDPCLDLLTGKKVGHGVKMLFEVDMIIEANPAYLPFSKDISLDRKRPQRGIVELFKQLSPCAPNAAQNTFLVQIVEEFANRFVHVSKALEDAVTQPTLQPALHDANRRLDFRLVARPAWPRGKNRAAVMCRHPGVGAIDLRIKMACLDDGNLGIIGNEQSWSAAEGLKRKQMAFDPVGKGLAPGMGKRQA